MKPQYRWPWVLVLGAGLFIALDFLLRSTGNGNFLPALLFVGAFLIPLTMVVYFYEHIRDRDISRPMLMNSFIVGGGLGLIAAGVVEYSTLAALNIPSLVAVGFIEESAKLIFPLIVYAMWRDRHEADGLIFGVAVGMGFAALETTGYGITALRETGGDIGALEQLLVVRGILSPAGHAAWTGLVCATLWRERERAGRPVLNAAVAGFFLLAVLLHFLWNVVNTVNVPAGLEWVLFIGLAIVAGVSLGLLIWRYREARRDLARLAAEPPPPPVASIDTPA